MRILTTILGVLLSTGCSSLPIHAQTPRGLPAADDPRPPAADDPRPAAEASNDDLPLNVPTKTLGGRQWWTDLLVYRDWRIQKNSGTEHCRLLDPRDVRRAWGSFEQCLGQFEKEKASEAIPPLQGRVVLLLHGLMGTRQLLDPLKEHLEKSGFTVMSMSYASTRGSIDDHAEALAKVIEGWGGEVQQIDFVGHSLGNLIVRRYLGGLANDAPQLRRVGRFVMIAPPNQGAQMARTFRRNMLIQAVLGPCGRQLANFDELRPRLATPPTCEFGIIAGGGGGRNPILGGDDDLMVGIDETKLDGARDFVVVDSLHRGLVKDEKTLEYVERFLRHGYFVTETDRHPLLPSAAPSK